MKKRYILSKKANWPQTERNPDVQHQAVFMLQGYNRMCQSFQHRYQGLFHPLEGLQTDCRRRPRCVRTSPAILRLAAQQQDGNDRTLRRKRAAAWKGGSKGQDLTQRAPGRNVARTPRNVRAAIAGGGAAAIKRARARGEPPPSARTGGDMKTRADSSAGTQCPSSP